MNAEFNWWLLIVGLVVGAGLVWLVIADWSRRDHDLDQDERSAESAWIAHLLHERGVALDPSDAEQVLALHRAYLHHLGGGIFDDELPADNAGPAPAQAALDITAYDRHAGGSAAADATTETAADVPTPANTTPTDTTPANTTPTDTTPTDTWLHAAHEDVVAAGSNESPPPAPAYPNDAAARGSLRSNPLAPRGGPGMDAEPPRPS